MSKRQGELFLLDILVAAAKIAETRAMHESPDSLKHHYRHWDSVIREFEIIGEATKHLIRMGWLDENEKRLVDFRNLVSHYYFGIDAEAVVEVIDEHMPPFEERVKNRFLECPKEMREEALETTIEENEHIDFVKRRLETLKESP
ncbi:HepT-like ribonuclease domain-containing protein [Hydrogenimonas sp.]